MFHVEHVGFDSFVSNAKDVSRETAWPDPDRKYLVVVGCLIVQMRVKAAAKYLRKREEATEGSVGSDQTLTAGLSKNDPLLSSERPAYRSSSTDFLDAITAVRLASVESTASSKGALLNLVALFMGSLLGIAAFVCFGYHLYQFQHATQLHPVAQRQCFSADDLENFSAASQMALLVPAVENPVRASPSPLPSLDNRWEGLMRRYESNQVAQSCALAREIASQAGANAIVEKAKAFVLRKCGRPQGRDIQN